MEKDLEFFKTLLNGLTTKFNSLSATMEANRSWNRLKDRPFYEDTDGVHKIDEKFIPNSVARSNTVRSNYINCAQLPSNLTDKQWHAIAYGNGRFVAISDHRAAYSEDGIVWFESGISSYTSWEDIAYGNGRFVVIHKGEAAYSTDGRDWTIVALRQFDDLRHIAYGNGKFVAVGHNSNYVAYSEDGTYWTFEQPAWGTTDWGSIAYGNGKFVIVAQRYLASDNTATDKVVYSEDGVNWTISKLPFSTAWIKVTYGNGKFIAFPNGYNNKVAYSEDGITWHESAMSSLGWWGTAVYGKDKFVALSSNQSSTTSYSEDGIHWHESHIPGDEHATWDCIAYGNDRFVAIPVVSDTFAPVYSFDGITWFTGDIALSIDDTPIPLERIGAVRKSDVQTMINETLGVIENGTY